MAVLVVLLAAMLFVGAAAAGTDNGPIFVYQKINTSQLNASATGDAATVTLYKMSEGSTPAIIDTIKLTNGSILWDTLVGQNTGVWYIDSTDVKNANYTAIWYPEVTLKAELATEEGGVWTTAGDSIDGKTINRATNVSFILEAPKLAGVDVDNGKNATVDLVFTTPVGGKTKYFGGIEFAGIQLNTTREVQDGAHAIASDAAGTWTVQAEFAAPLEFENYADKSNTVSFTLQSTSLVVTAAQDSVIRSNPFTITISGNANALYNVTIQNPETEDDKNPQIQKGQNGMQPTQVTNGAQFKTDASGQRTIQFNTNSATEDKSFTIRVTNVNDKNDWDEVKVKVEKGAVTISASGDGSYYIGTEITLSGTNTDSEYVYLFITGPNLNANGVKLLDVAAGTSAATGGTQVVVKTDNTWEQKWNTAQTGLDTGAYTIYATSDPIDKSNLSNTEYATVSVNLKQPFLSAVPSGTIVAKGDDIYIRGTAEGEPNDLKIYIFGPNKFVPESVSVEDDGTYEKKIKIDSDWASNQYFVVIQHPMYNGVFDAKLNDTNKDATYFYINNADGGEQASFYVTGTNKLQGSNAADALTKMIDSANIDDIYTKLTFTVTEPRIDINNPGDQGVGTKFTISGTTNLAVDDQILVEVASSSFNAVDKTSTSITDGVSMTTKVVAGEGADNTWSVEV
ncbi:MAG TPA: PGF-CTERM sorting domain-containing protein, partial [Methanocorpusculum sp.]|nr:PGF-CTERM sorting domain-containing protein [Methanocorpusculum sp.]